MKEPLILSYSYSGHTHRIAQVICALTGGSWCEIYPRQPYPMAFPELLDQVRREVQTGYHPVCFPAPAARNHTRWFLWARPTGAGRSRLHWLPGWLKMTCLAKSSCRSIPTAVASLAISVGMLPGSAPRQRSVRSLGRCGGRRRRPAGDTPGLAGQKQPATAACRVCG